MENLEVEELPKLEWDGGDNLCEELDQVIFNAHKCNSCN